MIEEPIVAKIPQHIAFIMDGNGRWATQRNLPRLAGHKVGLDIARNVVQSCAEQGVKVVTLFAFSSENWRRPSQEVNDLMDLFSVALQREVKKLNKSNVVLRVIGSTKHFSAALKAQIEEAQKLTEHNHGLILNIAVDYGGQWDILQATRHLAQEVKAGRLDEQAIDYELFSTYLSTAGLPDPDLLVRTSGETRLSNFLLWQLAYTELFFTDILWPDFDEFALSQALTFFASRKRRFGSVASTNH